MSGKIMGKVWDLDLPHNQLLVLLALADHADHEGNNVFPSMGLVAWKTGYSEKQVRRVVKELVACKILIQKGSMPGKANRYSIDIAAGKMKPERKVNPPQNVHTQNVQSGQNDPSTLDMPSAKKDKEPSLEPSNIASGTRKQSGTVSSTLMNPMKNAIASAFNWSWEKMTGQEKGLIQRAAKELCQAAVDPEDVPSLYAYCKRNFTSFKPMALPGNVSEWRKTHPSHRIIRDDGYIPVEERTSVLDGVKLA